jgi:hypothetical protein
MDAIVQKRLAQGDVGEAKAAEEKSTIASRAVDSGAVRTLARRLLSGMRISNLERAKL